MRLVIDNLGRIGHGELEIRPLTVLVGPNNTNKTWAAYALFGLMRRFSRSFFFDPGFFYEADPEIQRIAERETNRIVAELIAGVSTQTEITLKRIAIIGELQSSFSASVSSLDIALYLGIEIDRLRDARAELLLDRADYEQSLITRVDFVLNRDPFKFIYRLYIDDKNIFSNRLDIARLHSPLDYIRMKSKIIEKDLKKNVREAIMMLICGLFPQVAPLPIERSTLLSLLKMTPHIDRHQFNPIEYPSLSLPALIFHRMMQFLNSDRANFTIGFDFADLAALLEDQILAGSIGIEHSDRSPQRSKPTGIVDFQFGEGQNLRIHAAASMVRSLAGLGLYLKHLAERGSMIIIDEPEMNAHPDAQLQIIEFLALLVNRGLRVVFTTHSPYIVDHINNLMTASMLTGDDRESISRQFKLGRSDVFLHPEQVSAYLFTEAGEVKDILDREDSLIDIKNFTGATEYLGSVFSTILDAIREERGEPV